MFKEFRAFIAQGNMLDLAVGVIIGAAFTTIVKSFVNNLINPLIGAFVQTSALGSWVLTVGKATFYYGAFLNDVINFLITAFIVFLLIRTINKILRIQKKVTPKSDEVVILEEIRDTLRDKK